MMSSPAPPEAQNVNGVPPTVIGCCCRRRSGDVVFTVHRQDARAKTAVNQLPVSEDTSRPSSPSLLLTDAEETDE